MASRTDERICQSEFLFERVILSDELGVLSPLGEGFLNGNKLPDGQYQRMNTGDAFRFRSNRPHMFRNDSELSCQILWVLAVA